MMKWYFIDFDIMDENSRHVKWSNIVVESDAKPDKILNKARTRVLDEMPIGYSARARVFNEVP